MTAIPPGENAEDCPRCDPTDPAVAVYPWICPGHPGAPDDEAEKAPDSVVRIDLAAFRGLVDVAHNLGSKHLDCDQYAAMQLVVRQAPALLTLVAEQAATIAHYDTALIETTRDLTRAREHIADLDGQIEGQDQALGAADADRDRQAAEIDRLRADRDRMHLALAQERHERAEAAEWPDDGSEADDWRDEYIVQRTKDGEWTDVGWIEPDRDRALEVMNGWADRRSGWLPMRVVRVRAARRVVASRDVVETRDASRAPESPADAPDPSNDPRSG
ncbi:hypothetical protein ACIBSV_47010 [Embleya sp. NPDC050154]|uniref:hypothetical protein n=1 Tax=Embleya sp. NPDC050154 TaxID=3363988 RepID=UPI0037B3FDF1